MNVIGQSSYRPPLRTGDVGKAVEAAQRAAASLLVKELHGVSINHQNGQYGQGMLRDIRVIQRVFDIRVYTADRPDGYVTGWTGKRTWAELERHLDARGHALLNMAEGEDAAADAAAKAQLEIRRINYAMVTLAHDAVEHPSHWWYDQRDRGGR